MRGGERLGMLSGELAYIVIRIIRRRSSCRGALNLANLPVNALLAGYRAADRGKHAGMSLFARIAGSHSIATLRNTPPFRAKQRPHMVNNTEQRPGEACLTVQPAT